MNIKKFFEGDSRTVKAKKNIIVSVGLKGIDALVYLLLVPVTLGYLNPYEYGIWLTLNSILMWINSFDIGLGNGLRNKLTIAEATHNHHLGRIYVSTTFFMLVILMGLLILIGSLMEPLINWYSILSTSPDMVPHLERIVYMAFVIFCLNFIFKFIGNIYLALQLPAVNNLIVVIGHLVSLIIIFILTKTTSGSLFWVAFVYSASPLLVYLIAYPITFNNVYPYLSPNIRFFKRKYLKELLNIGLQFFLLQLSAILLFAFSNLLISHMFGPENVTPYNIAYRYFSLVPMVINLILAPMWSATTDAYTKGDIEWIKRTMKGIRRVLIIVTIGILIMILISECVYRFWIGTKVQIPFMLSALMGLYICIIIWSLSYSNFLNGLCKLKIQTLNTVAVALLFIPLCYLLGKEFGVTGIVIAMCMSNISGLLLNIIQFNKVIKNRAKGLWNS